jgi:TonB family protein
MDDLKNDIEKYLRGELPAREMHALEKRALDDPFLADALEGASGIDAHDFTQDAAQLRQALNTRVSPKKTIPLWVWPARIAAGLLLIAVATFVIIRLQAPEQEELLSYDADEDQPIEKQATKPTPRTDSVPDSKTDYLALKDEAKEESTPAFKSPGRVTPAKPQSATARRSEAIQPEISQQAVEEEVPAVTEPLAEADGVATKATPPVASQPAPEARKLRYTTREEPELAQNNKVSPASGVIYVPAADSTTTSIPLIVQGRVTADDGTGLPGVNVVIKGSATGTVTDINGNYQVKLTDPGTTLVYSFIGMESKEVPIDNNPMLNVTLNPDAAELSEVVVVGYGEGKDEDDKPLPTFDMAEPAGGRRAFKKYLADKMVYPQEALDNKIEGRVTVQFTVETSGQVSNFNIVKGLGYGCDDEVIRLIKEGPRWSPMKRDDEPVKGRVRVRMRFTLPKKK